MRSKSSHLTAVSVLFAAVVLLHPGASFAQDRIGVAAAVKNQVTGNARPLVAGSGVRAREVVRTGADSMAQLLFLDETSLNIGPQSEVTLDRFVYDPNRRAGNVVINSGRGAFRFVSGSQQPTSYQIKTPVATVGVRGTVIAWATFINKTIFVQEQGSGFYRWGNREVTLDRPGAALILHGDGRHEITHFDSIFQGVTGAVSFPLSTPAIDREFPGDQTAAMGPRPVFDVHVDKHHHHHHGHHHHHHRR